MTKIRLRSPERPRPPHQLYVCGWDVDTNVPYLTTSRGEGMIFRSHEDARRLADSCPDIADYEAIEHVD